MSHDKLTELDVIVEDDEGCDWVTIIFGFNVWFSFTIIVVVDAVDVVVVVFVGVGLRDPSGDGDLVRQFFNHKSGVIRFSTRKIEKN